MLQNNTVIFHDPNPNVDYIQNDAKISINGTNSNETSFTKTNDECEQNNTEIITINPL
jgi:hypothetical protein